MLRLAPTADQVTTVGRALFVLLLCLVGFPVWGQNKLPKHYLNSADLPPGVIGQRQLQRGGPLAGYFQAVEVIAPAGAIISLAEGGAFHEAKGNVVNAGMQIGYVYQLRVGNIRFREGAEVYPTIEVVDRLYPPPGQEGRFPIPIELTVEELQMAADGKYVTRVIYLEDPQRALAVQDAPQKQRYFEVGRGEDPLEIADRMGRPMAILRMGSRIPDAMPQAADQLNPHEPPLYRYERKPAVERSAGLEPRIDLRRRSISDPLPPPPPQTMPTPKLAVTPPPAVPAPPPPPAAEPIVEAIVDQPAAEPTNERELEAVKRASFSERLKNLRSQMFTVPTFQRP